MIVDPLQLDVPRALVAYRQIQATSSRAPSEGTECVSFGA
jgi:hypothetical protein